LGSDNHRPTEAVLSSLITTCREVGVDPVAYLRDVFDRFAAHPQNRLKELLPEPWAAERSTFTP